MVKFNLAGYFQPWKVTFEVQHQSATTRTWDPRSCCQKLGCHLHDPKGYFTFFLRFVCFPTGVCGKPPIVGTMTRPTSAYKFDRWRYPEHVRALIAEIIRRILTAGTCMMHRRFYSYIRWALSITGWTSQYPVQYPVNIISD